MILSLYARGMTTRDIKAHLPRMTGWPVLAADRATVIRLDPMVGFRTLP